MNDNDRKNLEFLLKADPETLKEWYQVVETDDIVYALELITLYSNLLKEYSQDEVVDCTEAKEVLRKYTLSKS